jgi:hypothetical protein
VFPVRYGLDLYMLFRLNSVFKGLTNALHDLIGRSVQLAIRLYPEQVIPPHSITFSRRGAYLGGCDLATWRKRLTILTRISAASRVM